MPCPALTDNRIEGFWARAWLLEYGIVPKRGLNYALAALDIWDEDWIVHVIICFEDMT